MKTYDALICGAGAAGLTFAIELARRGLSFRIIEKLERPFAGSRGKGLQPRTLEIFEDLGVLKSIFAAGGEYPNERIYAQDGSYRDRPIFEKAEPNEEEPYPTTLMVAQYSTEAILRNKLAEWGAEVAFSVELIRFEQTGDHVDATVQTVNGTETLRARFLIGADGGRSFVRHHLNIDFPGETLGVRAVVADLKLRGLSDQYWHRWNEGDRRAQLGLCALRGTDLFILQAPVPMEGEIDLSVEGLSRLIAERTSRPDLVVESVSWASAFQMNARLASHYRVGNVFLCGDAAHIHPPTGGQGLNTSLQDAYNLAWKLAAVCKGAHNSLLESYETERRPIAENVLGLSTKLLKAAQARGGTSRGRDVQQLDLGYPDSPLALHAPERSRELLSAGARAPDAPCVNHSGNKIRLFDLFQGPHFTLLVYNALHEPNLRTNDNLKIYSVGPDRQIRDSFGAIKKSYTLQDGDLVLVRPDGYIGAIGPFSAVIDVRRDLQRFGLP